MDKKETISDGALLEIAGLWDLDRWISECKNLLEKQLAIISPLANPVSDAVSWKEKLHALFFHLSTHQGIETFGKTLDSTQLIEMIRFVSHHSNDPANRQKLSSLFAGISSKTFKELLMEITDEELSFLREEAVTETIQHHLSILSNELDGRFARFCDALSAEEKKLETLDLESLDLKDTLNLYRAAEKFYEEGNTIYSLTNKVLAVAWNTQRADLIQELGRIKELCQKYLLEGGDQTKKSSFTFGIRDILKKKTEELFSDSDPNGIAQPMKDSTPALEALVKFSIWNIQDYCDIGLLDPAKGSQSSYASSQAANLQNRDKLFLEAENNLGKIGLKTLADLKSARIYSKKALIEYISTRAPFI